MNDDILSSKYKLGKIDLNNPTNSHEFQILFTGSNKKVLEIGTATGYISKILKEKNCQVTGVEINPDWANEASKYVDRMIVGNIENLDFKKEFPNEKFDVILLGDTLEHLQNPVKILTKFHNILNDDGYLVCSIPNISYFPIRLNLLNGEFLYESSGILDKTHYHFYTLDNILLMFDESNFHIEKLHRIIESFFLYHRTDLKHTSFHDNLISSILKDSESQTFQFIVKVKPNMLVNKSTREYLIKNFPKNYASDELKFEIDEYLRRIKFIENSITEKDKHLEKVISEKDKHLEKVISEKDQFITGLQSSITEKDKHLEKVISEKDKHLENVIKDYQNEIIKIKQNKIMRILRIFDKIKNKS